MARFLFEIRSVFFFFFFNYIWKERSVQGTQMVFFFFFFLLEILNTGCSTEQQRADHGGTFIPSMIGEQDACSPGLHTMQQHCVQKDCKVWAKKSGGGGGGAVACPRSSTYTHRRLDVAGAKRMGGDGCMCATIQLDFENIMKTLRLLFLIG